MTEQEIGVMVDDLQERIANLSVRLDKIAQKNGFPKELKEKAKACRLKYKKEQPMSCPCRNSGSLNSY